MVCLFLLLVASESLLLTELIDSGLLSPRPLPSRILHIVYSIQNLMVLVCDRRPDEDSDSEFRDSSSDGSSDYETDRLKYLREQRNHQNLLSEIPCRIDRLSLREPHFPPHEDCSSDEGESINSQGCLLFEYFEQDLPYCREPLADKVIIAFIL